MNPFNNSRGDFPVPPLNISDAPDDIKEFARDIEENFLPLLPEFLEYTFKPLDFIREYYYYEYQGKQYRLPYPKVKQFFYLIELLENYLKEAAKIKDEDERALFIKKNELKTNTRALYILLNDKQNVLEGKNISYLWMSINIKLRRNSKGLIKGIDGLMKECQSMLSFTPVSHSDYTPTGLLTLKDVIASIATQYYQLPNTIMDLRIPAYAASLHFFDVKAYEEKNQLEQDKAKHNT